MRTEPRNFFRESLLVTSLDLQKEMFVKKLNPLIQVPSLQKFLPKVAVDKFISYFSFRNKTSAS